MNDEIDEETIVAKPKSKNQYLRNLWYMGAISQSIYYGEMKRVMLLGEPVLIGRTKKGAAFALRDVCPHRAVPLSKGKLLSDDTVECPYHGWRFRADGGCALIPSLLDDQKLDLKNYTVRSYPVIEQDGLIWIYVTTKEGEPVPKDRLPPKMPINKAKPRWVESQAFPCSIDHAVVGLMDPAHGPYVHGRWWWRKKPQLKEKDHAPLSMGFEMCRHRPTKLWYKILYDPGVQIKFELPSTRIEHISGFFLWRRIDVIGLTTCTPTDDDSTQVTQVFYWPIWLSFIKPLFWAFGRTFLGDDRRIVEIQRDGLKFESRMRYIPDSDVPAIWYRQLKDAWTRSVETGEPFKNPVKARTLRWKS